jgi:ABC-type sugar transport system substrate-binding protein
VQNYKKVFVLVMAFAILLSVVAFAGCSSKTSTASTVTQTATVTATADNSNIFIGASGLVSDQPWCAAWFESFKNEAVKQGVKYTLLDAKFDVMLQDQQMAQLIQEKPDVLIAWPVDSVGIGTRIKEANAKGIPIINAESKVDPSLMQYVTYVGYDTRIAGTNAVEFLNEALKGQGRILAIYGMAGYETTEAKTLHTEDLAKYPGLKVLESQYTDSSRMSAEQKMANVLTKYGPKDFDAVYVNDDNQLQGVITALKARNYNPSDYVIVTGAYFGSSLELIQSGVQYGTSLIDPRTEAETCVQVAIRIAKGENVPATVLLPVIKVTKANVGTINAKW